MQCPAGPPWASPAVHQLKGVFDMTQHTFTPLKLHHAPNGMWSIGARDDHPSHPEFEIARLETSEAYAQLFTAAPELLAALKRLHDKHEADHIRREEAAFRAGRGSPAIPPELDQARRAIASSRQ